MEHTIDERTCCRSSRQWDSTELIINPTCVPGACQGHSAGTAHRDVPRARWRLGLETPACLAGSGCGAHGAGVRCLQAGAGCGDRPGLGPSPPWLAIPARFRVPMPPRSGDLHQAQMDRHALPLVAAAWCPHTSPDIFVNCICCIWIKVTHVQFLHISFLVATVVRDSNLCAYTSVAVSFPAPLSYDMNSYSLKDTPPT